MREGTKSAESSGAVVAIEAASTEEVLAELRSDLGRAIARLPASCEWRWVALRMERALARHV